MLRRVLYELHRAYGPDGLRQRVAELLGEVGVLRVSGTVRDEPDEPEPELLPIGLRGLTPPAQHPPTGL